MKSAIMTIVYNFTAINQSAVIKLKLSIASTKALQHKKNIDSM